MKINGLFRTQEQVFTIYIFGRGLISRIYKEFKNKKKSNNSIKKNGVMKWTHSSQEIKHKWPKEKCLALLAISEMQIKTTLGFCLSPVKTAVI